MDSPGSIQMKGFCPNCGQRTLVAKWGMVGEAELACTNLGCDDLAAASKIIGECETEHIVMCFEETYTIKHPLRERINDELYDCTIAAAFRDEWGPPREGPGLYRVTPMPVDPDSMSYRSGGGLIYERIGDLPEGADDED